MNLARRPSGRHGRTVVRYRGAVRSTDRPDRLISVFTGSEGHSGDDALVDLVADAIIGLRQQGISASVRVPAQSFDETAVLATPADRLSGLLAEPASNICPPRRWFEMPLPPPIASDVLGRPRYTIADLVAETHFHPATSAGFVAVFDGPATPLAHDGDGLALVERLRPDLAIVVATGDASSINPAALAAQSLAAHAPTLIALERSADGPAVAWLTERFPVVVGVSELLGQLVRSLPASA